MPSINKVAALDELYDQLKKLPLYPEATSFVMGEGSVDAAVMFIGEAPGAEEDKQGRPFVGAAGKFLNEMLSSIGLKREDVYISNIVKQRPPGNRDPEPGEIAAHWPILEQQVAIIDPRVVVTLGRFSMEQFLPGVGKISQVHGRAFRRKDGRIYVPFYHPAAALYNGGLRKTLMDDFQKLPKIIALGR